ncbi:MAG TPA: bifunctional isocitrate dehydrogenase kinase/phosphatase [Gaiellaceae bacterium]|nr:bifunctional isocitrate dehydrogenase kinase/phosphatase [Gaiellaceae bacterium]
MTEAPTAATDIAQRIAVALIEGFDRHYALLRATSAAAKERFEAADWAAAQRAVRERIRYYDDRVAEAVERLGRELDAGALDEATWQRAKLLYIGLLVDHKRPELAETFFNSVSTRVLGRTYLTNDLLFLRAAVSTEYIPSDPPNYRSYYPTEGGLRESLRRIFADFRWSLPFADLDRDVEWVVRALKEHAGGVWPAPAPNLQLQVLSSAFYRNKAAYVVGKFVNGDDETPFVVPVLHCGDGRLELDTILLEVEDINILFSLSRAYFMVDMDVPSGYVGFLQSLMPEKPRSELYTAVGLGKQGKTLFYRDLRHHLHHSQDLFVEAPGTRGQVMHVFNLPSYPYVFKVIKDRFGPTKRTDRETVMRKFQLVKEVDRVGRMVDALEFVNLALPRERFAPELVEQLLDLAPSSVELDGEHLVVRHCYVERRMTPLNVYLATATPEHAHDAVDDYGNAIRELAIANVFPGDLLFRNFGLTRYGRVVFYDYDEIEYLTDCVFRSIPPAPNPEAELADEPWYGVGPTDVFPEEWEAFLLRSPLVREPFLRHHADLLRPAFWQDAQRRTARGEVVDFFPYPERVRFRNRRED